MENKVRFKTRALQILAVFWTKIIPMLLVTFFFVGLGFCMFNIWKWSLAVTLIVDIILYVITFIGFMKLIKVF